VLSSLFATSCTVGEVPTNRGNPDGGSTGCVDRIAPPGPAHTHKAGGGSNAGMNCVAGACHLPGNTGTDAPPYQYAGTVYVNGTRTPSAGATIQIKLGAMVFPAVTDAGGNFSFDAGTLKGTFSAEVVVSACPGSSAMVGALVSGGDPSENNCNGCHGPGGTTTPVQL